MRSGTLRMASLNSAAGRKAPRAAGAPAAPSALTAAALARMESAYPMVNTPQLLAAVDLGSNSFRLIVGRVEETDAGSQIYQVDALREPVRLAAGLSRDKMLDRASQVRGWDALKRFGERLRDFHPDHVRAVATNTLRIAKNAGEFLGEAQAALGFPIEVIAGREEARLIYAGAAHSVPASAGKRLVVDIGGGSTEFIIGSHYTPIKMESLYIGCVSHSRAFFPAGNVDEYTMRQAELAAGREIQIISAEYKKTGWEQAIGSSGTARALAELVEANGFNDPGVTHGISRGGLERLKRALIKAENVNRLKLVALKADRIPVLAGGLSIMIAVFDELGVDYVDTTDGALRLGVLYDLLGRSQHEDMRTVTVEGFMRRYGVDRAQAGRIGELSVSFYDQFDGARRRAPLWKTACLSAGRRRCTKSGCRFRTALITSIRRTSPATRTCRVSRAPTRRGSPHWCSVMRASSASCRRRAKWNGRCCSVCGSRRCCAVGVRMSACRGSRSRRPMAATRCACRTTGWPTIR